MKGDEAGGSLLPGRNYNSGSYNYGFNGQLKDDEVYGAMGTSYTAEFWQYDARVGRRWNLDPVPQVGISDYAAFGLNPIANVDPNGAYFFGLFGSTSKQRQAADTYAAQNGGTVIDRHSKSIFVASTERLTEAGAEKPAYTLREQYFNVDGSLYQDCGGQPCIHATVNDAWDDWSESEGLLGSASYDFLDKGFLAFQGSPIGAVFYSPSERRHMNGTHASQSEVESGFVETAGTLVPGAKGPGMFKRLNAAQFSKQFKGNLARLSATSRGYANRAYNKGVDWINKGKTVANGAATLLGKLFEDDEAADE